MPNYNYRSNDYMRRSQCQRAVTQMPVRAERQSTSCTEEHQAEFCTQDSLSNLPIAMAYVPWHEWRNLYSAEKALSRGTIFEDLDKPFHGIGGCCR